MFSMEKKHQQSSSTSSSQMQYRPLKEYEIIHFNKNTFNNNNSFIIQSIVSSFVKYIDSKFIGSSSSSLSSLLLSTVYNIGPIPPSPSTKTAKMLSTTNNNNNSKKMETNRRPKNLFMNSNENCLLIFWLILVLFHHQTDSCDCFLQTQALRSERKQQQQQLQQTSNNTGRITGISNSELAYIRMIRSYSEEFMSSSEERERGLQFFGGSSAGSSSSSSSTTNKRISPYFETESISTNVTISEGSAFVHLPCRVKQLGDRTLSWIRRQDVQILTVGTFTYTSDQRFQVIHRENSDDWSLQISYPRKKDAGIYECQVSTIPKMNLFIQLNVIVSRAKIIEGPVLYLTSGSTLNLTCLVKDTPEPPDYIFWYYNGQVINYGSPRGIKVYTEKSTQTISKLIILKAQANDSGNYSCTPSNAEPAHIAVHIQNNANPAASIQHGKRSASREYGSNKAMSTMMMSPIGPFPMVITIILLLALYLS